MTGPRKRYSAAFKARIALEAAKQTRTLAELSRIFQVHPVQISRWKKQLLDGVESLFSDDRRRERDEKAETPVLRLTNEGTQALRFLRPIEIHKSIEEYLLGEKHRTQDCEAQWQRQARISRTADDWTQRNLAVGAGDGGDRSGRNGLNGGRHCHGPPQSEFDTRQQ